ncbi:MAG: methylthioribulose 1-phosphate dehydratase [Bacteroidetes bacterium]|nr:methylthioribulose 1-phosphate dehydratase [Bacteroidota bacterium]
MKLSQVKQEMVEVIKSYNSKGWSPATSTNYSFKDETGQIWVTKSGIDKSIISVEDFITVSDHGESIGEYSNVKPSAETLIHCVLYELFPETKFILHSHGPFPVLISIKLQNEFSVEGYEIQKGFPEVSSHVTKTVIPVISNNQDMTYFKQELSYRKSQLNNKCLIIKKHGTYAWGTTLFEAKRHLETLDYLCQCEFLNTK